METAKQPKAVLRSKVSALLPGGTLKVSESNGITVTAERSGCGKLIRFTRHTKDGFVVFSAQPYFTQETS